MKNLVIVLLLLSVLAFLVGAVTAFMEKAFLLQPEGYWRGAMALLGYAIALMLYKYVYPAKTTRKKKK